MTSHPVASHQTESLLVHADLEALQAIATPQFQSSWRTLADQCPWGTALQSPEFVCTWYECYGDLYRPLVLARFGSGGAMTGLIALAVERSSGKLTFAGAHQSEYNVWLAPPGEQTFITECLGRLQQLGFESLTFTYLPLGSPLEWLDGPWSDKSSLRPVQRPLLTVDPIDAVRESVGKKKNRRRFEKLQESGPLTFLQLESLEELDRYYDDIIDFYDFRIGAVHGTCPFRDDSRKRPFYHALMAKGLLHITVTKVGETVVASHIGMRNKREVVLGIVGHSPFQAIHSPGKLHILQLGLLMHEQGFASLDLTPGGDSYKEDRATRYDEAYELTVYLNPKTGGRQQITRSLAKTAAHALKLDKEQASRLRSLADDPMRAVGVFAKWTSSSAETRIYAITTEVIQDPGDRKTRRDCLRDLLAYRAKEAGSQLRQEFLKNSLAAIESGAHFYSVVSDQNLLLCAELGAPGKNLSSKLQYDYAFEPQSAVISELYLDPDFHDVQAASAALREIASDAQRTTGSAVVYVIADAADEFARQVIEHSGFDYRDSLVQTVKFGATQTTLMKR